MAPETIKIVSCQPSLQRVKKNVDFGHFLGCFWSIFLQIFVMCWMCVSRIFKAFQQSCHIKSRQEKQWFCIKNNIFAKLTAIKKNQENYKKTYQKQSWKQDSKKTPRRTNFPPILGSKIMKNEVSSPPKNKLRKAHKKKAKKHTTLLFQGHFLGGSGGSRGHSFFLYFSALGSFGDQNGSRGAPPRGHYTPRFLMILALFLCSLGAMFHMIFSCFFILFSCFCFLRQFFVSNSARSQ